MVSLGRVMKIIELNNIPNQRTTFTIDGIIYSLRIKFTPFGAYYDLKIDSSDIVGIKLTSMQPMIPYNYMVKEGNFIFVNADGDGFNYKNFNSTQILYYLDKDEMTTFDQGYFYG